MTTEKHLDTIRQAMALATEAGDQNLVGSLATLYYKVAQDLVR